METSLRLANNRLPAASLKSDNKLDHICRTEINLAPRAPRRSGCAVDQMVPVVLCAGMLSVCGYAMLGMWSPYIRSPRAADRQTSKELKLAVQRFAEKAKFPAPDAYILLALPGIPALAGAPTLWGPAIALHSAAFKSLPHEVALCLAAHEMGHYCQKKGAPPGFYRSLQIDVQSLSSVQFHAREYAAD